VSPRRGSTSTEERDDRGGLSPTIEDHVREDRPRVYPRKDRPLVGDKRHPPIEGPLHRRNSDEGLPEEGDTEDPRESASTRQGGLTRR
jgi:hypothetical protein